MAKKQRNQNRNRLNGAGPDGAKLHKKDLRQLPIRTHDDAIKAIKKAAALNEDAFIAGVLGVRETWAADGAWVDSEIVQRQMMSWYWEQVTGQIDEALASGGILSDTHQFLTETFGRFFSEVETLWSNAVSENLKTDIGRELQQQKRLEYEQAIAAEQAAASDLDAALSDVEAEIAANDTALIDAGADPNGAANESDEAAE